MGGNDAERVCLKCPSSWHHFGCPDQHCTLLGSDYDFNSWLPLPVAIATTSFVSCTMHTVKKDAESLQLSSNVKAFISVCILVCASVFRAACQQFSALCLLP